MIAIGPNKAAISTYYICIDGKIIPVENNSSDGAFDELFKSHFVFHTSYEPSLDGFYKFIQTFYYNLEVENTRLTPRVRKVRSWFLAEQK